jgi:hypothetical protein
MTIVTYFVILSEQSKPLKDPQTINKIKLTGQNLR